ncbi:MAG: hypothetical protein ACI4Q0_02485 [Oligosphaeraceae bacterium]
MMKEISNRPRNLALAVACGGLLFLAVGLFLVQSGHAKAMTPACISAVVTALMGVLAAGRVIFERRQRQEERDAAEYHRQHGSAELFGDADEAVRLATRANRQFTKYFIPVATISMGVALGLVVLNRWISLRYLDYQYAVQNPLSLAILAFCCCIATLVAGSFFIGVSREAGCRWIRPGAAWLLLTGFLFLLGSFIYFCRHFQRYQESLDRSLSKAGLVVLAVLAAEMILSFVIEFYRPRMPNEEERPLPESRLLSLFTEPGSMARNVANSLDYQFGFRVSDAWFYHFLERTIVPLFMVMVLAFWLMTCIVVVDSSETALRERFGKVLSSDPIGPGVYFKLPYPFEHFYRFSSDKVQELTIGGHDEEEEEHAPAPKDDGHGHGQEKHEKNDAVILWNVKEDHADEGHFLVGAKNVERLELTVQASGSQLGQQGVGLFSAHIPLFFRVKNLFDYAYLNRNASEILKNLAQRELLQYFIQCDWADLLGPGRGEAMDVLRTRIQDAADELQLGVEVVYVALTGIHPPFGVGEAFDRITSATVDRKRVIQDAQTVANSNRIISESVHRQILNEANAYKETQVVGARADAQRYAGQLLCYRAAPRQYMLNSYYDIFLTEGAGVRKFVITGNAEDQVLWLNLDRKVKNGLLDLNLSE